MQSGCCLTSLLVERVGQGSCWISPTKALHKSYISALLLNLGKGKPIRKKGAPLGTPF